MEEETIMTHLLGNSPKVKVLDLLTTGKGLAYSITDMAEAAGVGRSSIYRMLDSMLKDKILVKKGKYGRIQLYQINMEKPEIKLLDKFIHEVSKIESEKEIARQTLKVKVKASK
jgi:Fe2+ or Zn2+ uptake regulation protein